MKFKKKEIFLNIYANYIYNSRMMYKVTLTGLLLYNYV